VRRAALDLLIDNSLNRRLLPDLDQDPDELLTLNAWCRGG
jgi:hypothetical protein